MNKSPEVGNRWGQNYTVALSAAIGETILFASILPFAGPEGVARIGQIINTMLRNPEPYDVQLNDFLYRMSKQGQRSPDSPKR